MKALKYTYCSIMLFIAAWLLVGAIQAVQAQLMFGEPGTLMERFSFTVAASDFLMCISILLAVFWNPKALALMILVPVSWLMYGYINVGKFTELSAEYIYVPLLTTILAFAYSKYKSSNDEGN